MMNFSFDNKSCKDNERRVESKIFYSLESLYLFLELSLSF